MKDLKTKISSEEFTEDDIRILKEFGHYMADYKTLRRRRMDCFDEQGRVTMTKNGVDELENGRHFILIMMDFFESEDKAYCYRICAEIKEVLDEYDKKFMTLQQSSTSHPHNWKVPDSHSC